MLYTITLHVETFAEGSKINILFLNPKLYSAIQRPKTNGGSMAHTLVQCCASLKNRSQSDYRFVQLPRVDHLEQVRLHQTQFHLCSQPKCLAKN